jgi:putative photosynthetic complex assembly protein
MNVADPDLRPTLKLPVAAAATLVLAALLGAAAVRLSGISISEPDAAAIAVRELRFIDRSDGSIDVFDARTQALVETVRGEAGFVRGALRGLARERRRAGIGAEPPFELVARADGRLTLIDPSTSRRVDLEAFGPANSAEFARLLARSPS